MNTYYLTILAVFGIVAYMMIVDQNVADLISLIPRIIKLNIERFFWKIRFHPLVTTNKLSQWLMMRKYEKIAKQLQDEQSNKTDSSTSPD
jgi:hypothetical protein